MADTLAITDRQQRAFDLIAEKGFISLTELALLLDVSESTARRDLEALERGEKVSRTHGGAVCTQYRYGYRLAASERQQFMAAEKRAIAKAAAELLGTDKSIIINGGTTCCYVAELLGGRRLSVATNCPQIATMLSGDLETEVTLLGGYIYPRTGVALGETAQLQLSTIRASVGILGCASITEKGVYNANQIMVDMDRKIIQAADRVILVVDHSKFEAPGLIKQCDFDEIDVIVTDSGIDESWLKKFDNISTEIIVADVESEK